MATLDQKFEAFRAKYDLTEEATTEMLAIFNETFIELAHKLLSSTEITTSLPATTKPRMPVTRKTPSVSTGVKKFATKIAAEYAAERGFTLDDFDKEKITKKKKEVTKVDEDEDDFPNLINLKKIANQYRR